MNETLRNQEYWKAAVRYHERELAMQRRLLKRAKVMLAKAEKEINDDERTTTNSVG